MTQPKVKQNSKSFDLTFKINYQREGDIIRQTEVTVRTYETNLGLAIKEAINHIRTKIVSFHSIA
jgi:hypothetical protein